MSSRVLVTGGAGFIGSHLAERLLATGYEVRAFDNLCAQVHGPGAGWPAHLNRNVELIVGDIQDVDAVLPALKDVEAVFHLAAMAGVGQSMYEIRRYMATNNTGTAVLCEALTRRPVERLVVASSMSIYGEGLYQNESGSKVVVPERSMEQLREGEWDLHDNGEKLKPIPTPETKQPSLGSIYALSKYDQETMCMMVGRAHHIPTVALRFFSLYGPKQALSNPYTGVIATFASRILNDDPPLIYEDGGQMRDFVNINDAVRACQLALEAPDAVGQIFNVGSGSACTVRDAASRLAMAMGKDHLLPGITHRYRRGDVRHCFADITKTRQILGYEPAVTLEQGLAEMASWLESIN